MVERLTMSTPFSGADLPQPVDADARFQVRDALEAWKEMIHERGILTLQDKRLLVQFGQRTDVLVRWIDQHAASIGAGPLSLLVLQLNQRARHEPGVVEDYPIFASGAMSCGPAPAWLPTDTEIERTAFAAVRTCDRLIEWLADCQQQPPTGKNSVRLVGEVWHLRYQGESGEYPERGNRAIGWLAKLLACPRRSLAVADLIGDPEGKLAGDAKLGSERTTDDDGILAIKKRVEDIETIIAETGGNELLENELADLLQRLAAALKKEQIRAPVNAPHHNIATQLRGLMRKLKTSMPALAAHLEANLKLSFPHFGYYPPESAPVWKS
jgi:hypothetical protein